MKILLAVAFAALLPACASSTSSQGQAAPSPAAAARQEQLAEEEQSCRRSLTGPGKRKEGEECGGSTNLSCADGLKCVSKYRCPGAVGTCQKE